MPPAVLARILRDALELGSGAVLPTCRALHAAGEAALACPHVRVRLAARVLRAAGGPGVRGSELYSERFASLRSRLLPAALPAEQRGCILLSLARRLARADTQGGHAAGSTESLDISRLKEAAFSAGDCLSVAGLIIAAPEHFSGQRSDVALGRIAAVGHEPALRLLTARVPHAFTPQGLDNALRWAVQAGHTAAAQHLVADVGVPPDTLTPENVEGVCEGGHADALAQLLGWGLQPPAGCLRAAASRGHTPVVHLLLSRCGPDLFDQAAVDGALEAAVKGGHSQAAAALVAAGGALRAGLPSLATGAAVAALAATGADLATVEGEEMAVAAARAGRGEVVEELLAAGVGERPRARGRVLAAAAEGRAAVGCARLVRALLRQGGLGRGELSDALGAALAAQERLGAAARAQGRGGEEQRERDEAVGELWVWVLEELQLAVVAAAGHGVGADVLRAKHGSRASCPR